MYKIDSYCSKNIAILEIKKIYYFKIKKNLMVNWISRRGIEQESEEKAEEKSEMRKNSELHKIEIRKQSLMHNSRIRAGGRCKNRRVGAEFKEVLKMERNWRFLNFSYIN